MESVVLRKFADHPGRTNRSCRKISAAKQVVNRESDASHYILWAELGSNRPCLGICGAAHHGAFPSVSDALDTLQTNGQVRLWIENVYHFDPLANGLDSSQIVFSEQSALKAMRRSSITPEHELPHINDDLNEYGDEQDDMRLILAGVSESGVKMVFGAQWDSMFLNNILFLSGEAVEVKELVRAVAVGRPGCYSTGATRSYRCHPIH